ncbi:hypothetical protein [Candidatus Protofrankia californiensis]|uniref:hypothetical protein n=1 Tax=Candidatus Protofrankia californiensis TaxID=1839754 RepID=UPI00104136EB|nr:hypothetical protein [Candidatus Protofrankia californiensis]
MLVQLPPSPAMRREPWTVLGDDGPVAPTEPYQAHLTNIERSPNTVRAYPHDLTEWFVFLARQGLDWQEAQMEADASLLNMYSRRARYPMNRVPMARPSDHTMAEDLDPYVDQRVSTELIRGAVVRRVPIEVHGVYPAHFNLVATALGRRVQQSLGSNQQPDKILNGVRPELFKAHDPYGQELLCIAVPPGHDYVTHYASLVAHAMSRYTRPTGQLLRVWHYPDAEHAIAEWTGLNESLVNGAETVVLGKIELLSDILGSVGYHRIEHQATPYYDASTFSRPRGRRVTLLGVRFSYWGSIGGRLARQCCNLGAREIIYVGKLGTLDEPKDIYNRLFVPSRYGLLSGIRVRQVSDGPPNLLLDRVPALDSGLHVSVPTVLEEDHAQREVARLLGARTMDNELAQMALAVHEWNIDTGGSVSFSGLHYATDYLRCREETDVEVPYSLARGRSLEACRKRRRAERLIGYCLCSYFADKEVAAA